MRTRVSKILSLLLVMSLLLVSLVACGDGGATESGSSDVNGSDGDTSSVGSDVGGDNATTSNNDANSSESTSADSTASKNTATQNGVTQKPTTTTTTGTKKPTTTNNKTNGKGTTYYVSFSTGNDSNDGTSQASPVKTIAAAESLGSYGDKVLFKRGDIWRGEKMALHSGVTYGAYGTGTNPRIYGSAQNYSVKSKWKQSSSNSRIWYYDEIFAEDIGGIVFNDGADFGIRLFDEKDVNAKNEFYYGADGRVYLFSRNGNPAEQYSSIEFLPDIMLFDSYGISDVTVKDIIFKYAGRAAINTEGSIENIRIENCDFSWIGGVLWGGNNGTVRLGNAINIWGSCKDIVVTKCDFFQIYDTAFTPQFNSQSSGMEIVFDNVEFSNNTVNKCHWSLEFWVQSTGNKVGTMKNIRILNNVMRNAGGGWSANQRGTAGGLTSASHFETFDHECPNISNILIKGNTFDTSAGTLLGIRWNNYTPVFEGNTFIQTKGKTFGYVGGPAVLTFDDNIKNKILAFDKTAKVEFK